MIMHICDNCKGQHAQESYIAIDSESDISILIKGRYDTEQKRFDFCCWNCFIGYFEKMESKLK